MIAIRVFAQNGTPDSCLFWHIYSLVSQTWGIKAEASSLARRPPTDLRPSHSPANISLHASAAQGTLCVHKDRRASSLPPGVAPANAILPWIAILVAPGDRACVDGAGVERQRG